MTCQVLLFGAGVGYVPDFVFQSRVFWLLLAVVIAGILLYQQLIFHRKKKSMTSHHQQGGAKILYSNNGRSGHVWYRSREAEFAMYFEFSGGDCIASINIPGLEEWQKHTGLPLSQRDEVLDFIGQQVVKDQTTDGKGSFKVEGGWLNIMKNEKFNE
jgi:hypothetical protein